MSSHTDTDIDICHMHMKFVSSSYESTIDIKTIIIIRVALREPDTDSLSRQLRWHFPRANQRSPKTPARAPIFFTCQRGIFGFSASSMMLPLPAGQ